MALLCFNKRPPVLSFLVQRCEGGCCHLCMKYIFRIFVLVAFVTFGTGCKKNESNKKQFTGTIEGTWELRHASAAMNPLVSSPAAGNGHILKFSEAGYERYESHQLVKKGLYAIVADPTVESSVCLLFPVGQFTNRIVYDDDHAAEKQFLEIIGNKLIIVSGCYAFDAGHRLEYEKIAE